MGRPIVFGLLLISNLAFGQGQWIVDSSAVTFKIKNAGIVVNGTFNGLEADIDFHPTKIKKSGITASVDAGSVDTGIRLRNKHLRKSDYFHVEVYPRITLRSMEFQKQGKDQFLGIFVLDLKGRNDKITIPFSFQKNGRYAVMSGSFEIDRTDYDLGGPSLILANNVEVHFWIKTREE
jgi:polyisoprenoid-binding protein YceI